MSTKCMKPQEHCSLYYAVYSYDQPHTCMMDNFSNLVVLWLCSF